MLANKNSHFIISLDFELLWGVRDKRTIESYGENIRGVRKVIPALLGMFTQFDVHATFATVGFLFARDKKELQQFIPQVLPVYSKAIYSPYENRYIDQIGFSEEEDIYHYAPSLLKMIRETRGQEIASHTFSHYYCLEQASLESFEMDVRAAIHIAAAYGITLKSMVFPRNQYSSEHVAICKKLGFTAYRGNEQSFVYNPRSKNEQNRIIRGIRLADTYINVTGHHTSVVPETHEEIINLPASRFLRPYSRKLKPLESLRLKRIKDSMTHAAIQKENFHLWWHPHNFGINLKENMLFLNRILDHYRYLNNRYGMESKNMQEAALSLTTAHAL